MRLHGWTLRARLVALVLVLLTTVTLVIGLVTVLALQGFLVHRLGDQLTSAARRTIANAPRLDQDESPQQQPPSSSSSGGGQGFGPGDGRGPRFLGAPGNAAGTLGAIVVAQQVVSAGVVDDAGARQQLSDAAQTALARVPTSADPVQVHLPTLGDYLVLAQTGPDGATFVTGLPLGPVHQTMARLTLVVAGIGGVLLVGGGVGGSLIVRRSLRPLEDVASAATVVARTPLSRGQVALDVRVPRSDPRTEVGQVSSAVNAMIGHVERSLAIREASEQRVRGFVADASHELRTPLAAIRGYAELTRRSREPVPPDVAHALARVESEASRMTVLVEDLLLLARLDAGRPLDRAPLDLSPLLLDVLADARAVGTDHAWRVRLPDEPVVVLGDEARLHQVLANLLANARTHTPGGTTVTTTIDTEGSDAVVRVEDDGPGIPPDVLPTVFERFARGETSRSRSHGSTGLGLAIVHGIVSAHGGRVDVASRPGRTVFALRLPLDPAAVEVPRVPEPVDA